MLVGPEHDYTRALVDAVPDPRRVHAAAPDLNGDLRKDAAGPPLLAVEALRAVHKTRHGTVVAADDVAFTIDRGGCLAVVGESGSGKTTIARCIAGLHAPQGGTIRLSGALLPTVAGPVVSAPPRCRAPRASRRP